MSKEYNDRWDKPLREEIDTILLYDAGGTFDQQVEVIVGSMPWSGGQEL